MPRRYLTLPGLLPRNPTGGTYVALPAPTLSAAVISSTEIDLTAAYTPGPALSTYTFQQRTTGASGPSAPAPAAAVGFNTKTFDSTTLGTTAGTWLDFGFFGAANGAGATVQNGDGSMTITGVNPGTTYNAVISTATYDGTKSPIPFKGVAFRGGYYAEATFAFTGTPSGFGQVPAWWALDVETSSGYNSITTEGALWVETDFNEANQNSVTSFGEAFHQDYYHSGSAGTVNAALASPVSVPSGNMNGQRKYGALWVPATATTQGYLKTFVDGVQVGSVFWDQYNAAQGFPPSGANVGNIMDLRHMYLILGVSTSANPMTITSVKVWQANASNNLIQ